MGAAPSTPTTTTSAIASPTTSSIFSTSTVARPTSVPSGPYLPIPSRDASTQSNAPARKDIESMSSAELSLFVLAMQQWQRVSASQVGGFFQVAGIHGAPHTYWDNAGGYGTTSQGYKDGGYCFHGDQNFYLWHRPYVALVEQQMVAAAVSIANNWYAPQRAQYQQIASTLKFPYWDWAKTGQVPSSIANSQITVTSPSNGQSTTIANPLYSHTLVNDGNLGRNGNGQQIYVNQQQGRTTNRGSRYTTNMANIGASLRRNVALLFNTPTNCWNIMATYNGDEQNQCDSNPNIQSLESIHNTVHNTISGTMANLDVSAFDPIFWLHHCNVDRLGAIWQAINPSVRVQQTYDNGYTFVTAPDNRDENFSFLPFRGSQGNTDWWTPAESYDTRSSGYTYPELADKPSPNTVLSRVNNIYGNGRTQSAVQSSAKFKRGKPVAASADQVDNTILINPPSPAQLAPYSSILIAPNGSFDEYAVKCDIKRSAATGKSFDLHLFFGTVTGTDYINAPNRVGGISVSQAGSSVSTKLVGGVVPITDALLNKLITGGIKDLQPETVEKYVSARLVWRIVTIDGEDIAGSALDNGLALTVKHTTVTPKADKQAALPVVAVPDVIADTTNNTIAKPLPSGIAATTALPLATLTA